MSGVAELKEKTFERYFAFELARQTNVTSLPDLCDEAVATIVAFSEVADVSFHTMGN